MKYYLYDRGLDQIKECDFISTEKLVNEMLEERDKRLKYE
jgi:hypothetical protein